jgi:hypothetical protein
MTSTNKTPPKAADARTKHPYYQQDNAAQCSKYDRGFREYHYGERHKRTPHYNPELLPYQPGQRQYHLDPSEVNKCLEECDFEHTKCHKPPYLPQGRYPVIKKCKPEYAHKPTFSEIFGKIKSDYDQVKPVVECQINKSLHIWPYCTVGKIWVGANHNYVCPLWTGTGVLVGSDLILTVSHLVPWDLDGWWMRFIPAYSEGTEPFGSSYVMDVCRYSISGVTANDFAVCKLYKRLGEHCGWMSVDGWSKDHHYTSSLWNMVGYLDLFKDGEVQFFQGDEEVKKVSDEGALKLLKTNADPWGWCGGVLWGWQGDCPRVIGVLSGEDEELCIFINAGWAGGPGMMDLVRWAWINWE